MLITINGEAHNFNKRINVSSLIKDLQLEPYRVAIEKNLAIISIDDYDSTYINEGDNIEIVQFIGGG